MGCLVERYREELAQGIPEVAAWFGLAGGPDEKALGAAAGERRAAAGSRCGAGAVPASPLEPRPTPT